MRVLVGIGVGDVFRLAVATGRDTFTRRKCAAMLAALQMLYVVGTRSVLLAIIMLVLMRDPEPWQLS